MISLYCPENILFREAVEEFKNSFGSAWQADVKVELAQNIYKTFCSKESSMEINIPLGMKETLKVGVKTPTIDLFDAALVITDKDCVRSLQGFYSTDVFLSYFQHRALLDSFFHVSEDADKKSRRETVGSNASLEEVTRAVRSAYKVDQKVGLIRVFDVASPFHFIVSVAGTQVGWAVQRKEVFDFFDMQEVEVCRVSAAALLGKASLKPSFSETAPHGDDDIAQAGCCGPASSSASSASSHSSSSSVAPPSGNKALASSNVWYIRDPLHKVHGPIDQARMFLWWRYHLLPLETEVSSDNQQWTTVGELPYVFDLGKRIELLDPTAFSSL